MNPQIKQFWFNHYLIIIAAIVIAIIFVSTTDINVVDYINIPVGLIGIILSIIYFSQKQKLDEIKLFKELFHDFNERYDSLNGKLFKLKNSTSEITTDENEVLDDYFNLCSEEYLFFKEGRILQEVWGSWCRGMIEHLKNEKIESYWNLAQKENSYYGLTTQVIANGAKYQA
jgi:c-di-AMP phosphodiesterase-like protein